MEQLGSKWTDFHETGYLRLIRISAKKTKVSVESDKDNRYFMCRPMYLYDNMTLNSF